MFCSEKAYAFNWLVWFRNWGKNRNQFYCIGILCLDQVHGDLKLTALLRDPLCIEYCLLNALDNSLKHYIPLHWRIITVCLGYYKNAEQAVNSHRCCLESKDGVELNCGINEVKFCCCFLSPCYRPWWLRGCCLSTSGGIWLFATMHNVWPDSLLNWFVWSWAGVQFKQHHCDTKSLPDTSGTIQLPGTP